MQIEDSAGGITGGASGLGAGAASMLVERGTRVGILDLPGSKGEEFAASLGDAALFVPTDVSDEAQVEKAVDTVSDHHSRIDVCVNAAGVSPASRVLSWDRIMHPLDAFRRTLDVNLIGALDVLRHAVRHMSANEANDDGERGLIVNVVSTAALEGQVGQSAYSASKDRLVALTLPLARDLALWGVRVMTVCPGIMDTGMLAGVDEKRRSALMDLHVFPKRLGKPLDLALLVASFAENSLLNGDVVRLDAASRL